MPLAIAVDLDVADSVRQRLEPDPVNFDQPGFPAEVAAAGFVESVLDGVRVPLFDPSEWTDSDVDAVARSLLRLEAEIVHAKAVLCTRMNTGDRDANARVARTFRTTTAGASRIRQVSEIITRSPHAGRCLRNGSLTESHVRALHVVAGEPVETMDELAMAGVGLTVPEFENVLKKHLIDKDNGVELRERQKRAVGLRFGTDSLGLTTMHAKLLPEDGQPLRALVEHLTNQQWRKDHPTRSAVFEPLVGDQSFAYRNLETLKHLLGANRSDFGSGRFDTTHDTGTSHAGSNDAGSGYAGSSGPRNTKTQPSALPPKTGMVTNAPRPTVIVVVDTTTGTTEIAGQGPVPTQTAIELLQRDADLFIATRDQPHTSDFEPTVPIAPLRAMARVKRASKLYRALLNADSPISELLRQHRLTNVGFTAVDSEPDRRFPTLQQRLVVIIRDHHCVVAGCTADHTRCEVHHIIEYEHGGPTIVANLVLLCKAHHHWLHNNRYNINRRPDGTYDVFDSNSTIIASRAPPNTE